MDKDAEIARLKAALAEVVEAWGEVAFYPEGVCGDVEMGAAVDKAKALLASVQAAQENGR